MLVGCYYNLMYYGNNQGGSSAGRRQKEDVSAYRGKPAQGQQSSQQRRGQSPADQMIPGQVTARCAFHSSQKITNFCTSAGCRLPLCPKCVKIHTDEHVKMGVFGEFETIDESLRTTQEGLQDSLDQLDQFERLLANLREANSEQIAQQRDSLRAAKHYFLQVVDNIFDGFEKALMQLQSQKNAQFAQQLQAAQALVMDLSQQSERCFQKLGSQQTLMEAIINYYAQADQLHFLPRQQQQLEALLPQPVTVTYQPAELDRLDTIIKRFIDAGPSTESAWALMRQINNGDQQTLDKSQERKRRKESPSPPRAKGERMERIQRVERVERGSFGRDQGKDGNLNLGKFKSPLDNFSLARLRENKQGK